MSYTDLNEEHFTRENIIGGCRYYTGEDSNPYEEEDNARALLWDYERIYVDYMLNDGSEYKGMMQQYYSNYIREGIKLKADTPIALNALLYARYCHWSYIPTQEGFQNWYDSTYLGAQSKG